MYIDTHAHLDFPDFDYDRPEIIQRAKNADVEYIINIGVDISSSLHSIEISEKYDFIYTAAGIHPHDADKVKPEHWEKLQEMLAHPKVVALGEIGLDFYRNYSPRELQQEVLIKQLKLAVEKNLPIIVHTRNAWKEMLPIFEGEYKGKVNGVFHCFSGDEQISKRLLKLGFYISFTGAITFKNSTALEVAKGIPLNRLLLETDCPFMAPEPFRGQRNEPAYIFLVAEKIAQAKGINVQELTKQTSMNAQELFGIGQNHMLL